MRIAVVGAGGVGGYFGGLLAHHGSDVVFVARGAHLDAIRRHGLTVNSVHGDLIVSPAAATDGTAAIGPVDVILVCVKDFQVEEAIPRMRPLVGSETVIVPLLNGFRAADRLAQEFGRDTAVGGLCSVVAFVEAPGVIRQASAFRRVVFGHWEGKPLPGLTALYNAFRKTGADVELSADIRKEMWTKFLFITAYSGVASVIRLPAAGLHACQETMDMLHQAMLEIESVARAKGIALDPDVVEKTMSFVAGLQPGATSSMQRDVEAGRLFELEALTGSLVRAGIEVGVPTAVNRFIYAALKPQLLAVEGEGA